MVEAGLDVARLNFAHGNRDVHAENAERIRAAAGRAGRQVAILQDLPGPKIRIGALEDDIAELKAGDELVLVSDSGGPGDARRWGGRAGGGFVRPARTGRGAGRAHRRGARPRRGGRQGGPALGPG